MITAKAILKIARMHAQTGGGNRGFYHDHEPARRLRPRVDKKQHGIIKSERGTVRYVTDSLTKELRLVTD